MPLAFYSSRPRRVSLPVPADEEPQHEQPAIFATPQFTEEVAEGVARALAIGERCRAMNEKQARKRDASYREEVERFTDAFYLWKFRAELSVERREMPEPMSHELADFMCRTYPEGYGSMRRIFDNTNGKLLPRLPSTHLTRRHPGALTTSTKGLRLTRIDEARREIEHVISSPVVDRRNDVVVPDGMDASAYRKNPVVLADHDYRIEMIVGRNQSLVVHPDAIVATTRLLDTPLASKVLRAAKEGVGGWSIGFRPIAEPKTTDEGGLRYEKWELLEYSFVCVPQNQDAVNVPAPGVE